jgi:hypothetical protein
MEGNKILGKALVRAMEEHVKHAKYRPSKEVFLLGGFSIFMACVWKFATIAVDYGIVFQ